ncbi:3-dehydrosphinganine reductase [Tulasnella sp. 417]|nr:3-dehydrosphinganine reductase [Tulasnella sp. 417]
MGWFSKNWNPRGKHCYVTGGSSGLGLAVAIELVKRGAHVSIVARTEKTLQDALKTLETHRVSPDQKLAYYSYSLTTAAGAKEALEAASAPFNGRVPDAAFLVAGASAPKFFVEMDEADLRKGMDDGYWIQAFTAFELVKMTARQQFRGGKIVFVGSTLSFMSFVGWASYSPPKHALRGLADTLRNECLLYGTDVHMFFASTMKTPGYETEMKTKPKITAAIEGEDGVLVEDSAKKMLSGISAGHSHIAYDLVTNLFRTTTRGSTPGHNNILTEVGLTLIGLFGIPVWRWIADRQVQGHAAEHTEYLKSQGIINSS